MSCEWQVNEAVKLVLLSTQLLITDPVPVLLYSDSNGVHLFLKLFQQLSLLTGSYSTVIDLFDYSYNDQVKFTI